MSDRAMVHMTLDLIDELLKQVKGTFPYDDCFAIKAQYPDIAPDFIPDLDMFFYEVESIASSMRDTVKNPVQLATTRRIIERPFLDLHPKYSQALATITPDRMPKLYAWLEIHERLRQVCLGIIDELVIRETGRRSSRRRRHHSSTGSP